MSMLVDAAVVEWVSALANVGAALGTIGAVTVALFPDWWRDKVSPGSAEIELDQNADRTRIGDRQFAYMFNLRIHNSSRRRTLHRCVIVLDELSWPGADGPWHAYRLPVSLPIRWAPFETQPVELDLSAGNDATANLLWLVSGPALGDSLYGTGAHIAPVLLGVPYNFRGRLESEGRIRYHLQLRSDDLPSPQRIVIELEWNGSWPINGKSIEDVLTIKRLAAARVATLAEVP